MSQSQFDDLISQERLAAMRHVEPADAIEFTQNVSALLRDHRLKFNAFAKRFDLCNQIFDSATVTLKRLESFSLSASRATLQHLQTTYRNTEKNSANLGYLLDKCRRLLDETATTYQLVGATLREPLADKHKKVAVQQELSLRLKDIENYFGQLQKLLGVVEKQQNSLLDNLQNFLAKIGVKIPLEVLDTMSKEDKLKAAILTNQRKLRGKAATESQNNSTLGDSMVGSTDPFADTLAEIAAMRARTSPLSVARSSAPATASKMPSLKCLAAVVAVLLVTFYFVRKV